MNGEEATTPDDLAAGDADGREGFVARGREQRSVDGFLKLPLLGGRLVASMPSSSGAAPAAETEKAAT